MFLNIILWTLMECLHLFKAAKFGSLKMHVLCKVGKNIIFQNKTFLVMFYRQNKTFWYQFCNFKQFRKAENSGRQFGQFVTQQANGLFCHSTWVEWLLALHSREPNYCTGISLNQVVIDLWFKTWKILIFAHFSL